MNRGNRNMEMFKLYHKYDINGEYIFFTDKECTKYYTGHIEWSENGFLYLEADIVEGFQNGVYKEYFEKTKQIKQIVYCEHNVQQGLNIEFYESGKVHYISLAICNDYFDYYEFDENGNLIKKEIWPDSDFEFSDVQKDEKKIKQLRQKFNLENISEEIKRDGKNFDYEKYFKN